jgi:YD repeat-containing protein
MSRVVTVVPFAPRVPHLRAARGGESGGGEQDGHRDESGVDSPAGGEGTRGDLADRQCDERAEHVVGGEPGQLVLGHVLLGRHVPRDRGELVGHAHQEHRRQQWDEQRQSREQHASDDQARGLSGDDEPPGRPAGVRIGDGGAQDEQPACHHGVDHRGTGEPAGVRTDAGHRVGLGEQLRRHGLGCQGRGGEQ